MAKKNKLDSTEPQHRDNSHYVWQRDKIAYELNIRTRPDLTDHQKEIINLILDKKTKIVFITAPAGASKAQPLDSLVLTPNGWVEMGELSVGDSVCDPNGSVSAIVDIFPQGVKDIYRVDFSDGSSAESTIDHLWWTQTNKDRNNRKKKDGKRYKFELPGSVKTLEEIKNTLIARPGRQERKNHNIPICSPVFFERQNTPIDPYLMGVLLGDGGFTTATPSITNIDQELIDKCQSVLPDGMIFGLESHAITYSVKHKNKSDAVGGNYITNFLKSVNLYGMCSENKFVPDIFKYNSVEIRKEVIRGLMDTDGHVANKGFATIFNTTSSRLKDDMIFLVRSLGGTATWNKYEAFCHYKGVKVKGCDVYCVHIKFQDDFVPFYISRKKDICIPKIKYKPVRYIESVTLVGQKECQCILLNNESHLYITNEFVVTHNTYLSLYCALQLLNSKKMSKITYSRPMLESADSGSKLGALPGDYFSKVEPYAAAMHYILEELLPTGDIKKLESENRIEVLPVNYVRGLTFANQVCIFDECASFTLGELKTLLSRIGAYSKVILCCDITQSDLPLNKQGGFAKIAELFNDEESKNTGIHHVLLTEDEIVRSEICKYIVTKFKEL